MKFVRIDHVVAIESGEVEANGIIQLHEYKTVPAYLLFTERSAVMVKDARGLQFEDERLKRADPGSVLHFQGAVFVCKDKPGELRKKIERQLGVA